MPKARLYFDYAASTPVAPEVEAVMRPYFLTRFGNAGSLHSFGQEAVAALDESREIIAKAVGAGFREIIFTGSATEANNLALRGVIKRFKNYDLGFRNGDILNRKSKIINPRIIVSAIEHESVLETARDLEKEGIEIVYLPVSKNGIVDLKKLKNSINERTVLVSVMYANNEVGTIQPVSEIAKIITDFRKQMADSEERRVKSKSIRHEPLAISYWPLFHTDAVQAFQFLGCNVEELGVDLMTLSAHKIYGPKGIGMLYVKNIEPRKQKIEINNKKILNSKFYFLDSIIAGGGQEFGLRSGTENIPLIAGFAKAVSLVSNSRELENKRISKLRDYFWKELKKIYPAATRNGHPKNILPNFLNVGFPGLAAADLLVGFDLAGLAVSAGSACSARSAKPSHVMEAIGLSGKQSRQNIRFTLGRPTSKKDIDNALKIIRKLLL